jgi:hypothetical protein
MDHIIVETIEGYEFFKNQSNYISANYYSSNEEVILYLKSKNEKVQNIEVFLTKDEVNNIGKLSYEIQQKISDLLDNKCKILDNLKIGNTLDFSIFQSFFILIYKQSLLNKLNVKNKVKSKIICVGNPEPAKHSRMDLYFDRFDNIFSLLAKNSSNELFKNYEYVLDPLIQKQKKFKVENISLSKIEKFFSIIENSFSSFFFKIFKHIPITNLIFKKKIYVYGYNENIADLFFSILKKKYYIEFLQKPHKQHLKIGKSNLKNKYNYEYELENIIENEMHKKNIAIQNLKTPIFLYIKRLLLLINKISYHEDSIKDYYSNLTKNIKDNEIILSNGFYQTEDKLLYHFIKKKNTKVISFDHGVSIGMDKIRSCYVDKYSGTIGDIGVYSNDKAYNSIKRFYPNKKAIVVGQIDRYRKLFNIKKLILKIYYNIALKKKIIFIVTGPQYNNSYFSPHRERDRKVAKINKRLITRVCNEKKDYQVILKLYPGARYYNEYNYSDLEKFNNLKIIRDKDFRWLRYMADIIITHCNDSTLGQISNIDAKSYYYTFNDRPNNFKENLVNQNDFKDLKNLKLIKKDAFAQKANLREILKEL